MEKESDMFQCKLLEMMACLMGCSCFNKGDAKEKTPSEMYKGSTAL